MTKSIVQKYRKKPVVIEAIQLTDQASADVIIELTGGVATIDAIHIPTLEGVTVASHGDFVIRGVKGEFYACKPDIFEMTYELESANDNN